MKHSMKIAQKFLRPKVKLIMIIRNVIIELNQITVIAQIHIFFMSDLSTPNFSTDRKSRENSVPLESAEDL